jgi:hypothetical protein
MRWTIILVSGPPGMRRRRGGWAVASAVIAIACAPAPRPA